MGYSGFHRLCNAPRDPQLGVRDPRWQFVRRYLVDLMLDPERADVELRETQREGHSFTPLLVVCMLSPPADVVEDMIRLCPDSLKFNASSML